MPDVVTSGSERLSHLLNQGVKLPPLPASGLELINILRQPVDSLNVGRIAGLVENDPTLAANLLRIANSPMYGAARAVNRVQQAIVTMGLDETVQMLNYYLMRKLFPKIPEFPTFSAEQFWQHAWATATAARSMGQPQYLVHCLPGELYLAGLLHDIGKIVFSIYLTEDFGKCLERAALLQQPLHLVEQEIIGVDHATVGAQLLDSWNLPSPILNAIGGHHDPTLLEPAERELAGLIELANAIAHTAMPGASGNPLPATLHETWMFKDAKSPLAQPSAEIGILHEIQQQIVAKATAMNKKAEPEATEAAKGSNGATAAPTMAGGAAQTHSIPATAPAQHAPASGGGMMGWVKRLFGGH